MTPILHQLHWLPIRQRILFKTAVLVYKSRHSMAPPFLHFSNLRYISDIHAFISHTHHHSLELNQATAMRYGWLDSLVVSVLN